MRKAMHIAAAVTLIAFIVSFSVHLGLENGITEAIAITCGVLMWHVWMRIVVGYSVDYLMNNHADLSKKHWMLGRRERALLKRLNVKKWKNKVPTFRPDYFDPNTHTWEEIAEASCQAELVHFLCALLSLLPILLYIPFGSFWIFLSTSVAAAVVDLVFVILQRFNRDRIFRLLKHIHR